jgi:hypothetical protein
MTNFPAPLEQFRSIVLADPALQQELRQAPDRASFVRLVVARAQEQDCALDAAMVEAALDAAARDQLVSRWIEH